MKKQKICIIGGGLTGLITAITLSKLNLDIDLITDNINQNIKSNRTVAISQNNYNFLRKLGIFKLSERTLWSCSAMKLYTEVKKKEFTKIFELNVNKKQKKILYIAEVSTIMKQMIKNIKNKKLISLETQKIISDIASSGLLKTVKFKNKDQSKYNLIIICTGSNSDLVKTFFNNQSLKHSYNEASITTILQHEPIKNKTVRQIFFDNEILALLPISNTKTSIVWSAKKKIINKYKSRKDFFIKKRVKFYTKDFLKKVKFVTKIEYRDLNLLIQKKYYQDRILLFGDALHLVHPFVGQGFNMTLRDLVSLEETLKDKINLGLDVGSDSALSEFSDNTKSSNFIYSLGTDFIKKFFSFNDKVFKNLRNEIISVDQAGVEYIHIDIMDGHYVPNITFGSNIVKQLRSITNKILDVHLMISPVYNFIEEFIHAGADIISFHPEADPEPDKVIHLIQKLKCKAGIAIHPNVQVADVLKYLHLIDTVVVMTVVPGLGGQKFINDQIEKISLLNEIKHNKELKFEIEIDGGINKETAEICKKKGADVLVAGSYIYGSSKNKYKKLIESLR